MSTWIDFAVYATLIVLIFVLLPRNGRQFTVPTIADRNPQWLEKKSQKKRLRWFRGGDSIPGADDGELSRESANHKRTCLRT